MNHRGLVILAVCGALLAGTWWYCSRSPSRNASVASLRELLPGIASGGLEEAQQAKAAAARDWGGSLPVVLDMLADGNWRLRAVACEILAARGDSNFVPLLLARASDTDWRVRAAAFDGLGRFRPLQAAAPMMNTPLDQREEVLLSWLASYDASARRPLAEELCEVYANAAHVEFGRPMTQRCLSCHAGAAPQPFEASAACTECHRDIYQRWAGSAHANSLSHLRLATVDANTRSPGFVDFGAVRGIGCTECHRVVGARPQPASLAASTRPDWSPAGPASRAAACPFVFSAAEPASESCRRCHAETYQQWRTWQGRPHPMRLDWPPGQIDLRAEGDQRSCADCHMREAPFQEGRMVKDHAWSARRDPAFLRA